MHTGLFLAGSRRFLRRILDELAAFRLVDLRTNRARDLESFAFQQVRRDSGPVRVIGNQNQRLVLGNVGEMFFEVVGLDEAYLDVAGLYSPRAAMRRLLAEIKTATELTCSVGIGPNKLVAKVASDAEKPAGFVVLR